MPTELIASFHATLEDAVLADLVEMLYNSLFIAASQENKLLLVHYKCNILSNIFEQGLSLLERLALP